MKRTKTTEFKPKKVHGGRKKKHMTRLQARTSQKKPRGDNYGWRWFPYTKPT